jgi:hypothetical protein
VFVFRYHQTYLEEDVIVIVIIIAMIFTAIILILIIVVVVILILMSCRCQGMEIAPDSWTLGEKTMVQPW